MTCCRHTGLVPLLLLLPLLLSPVLAHWGLHWASHPHPHHHHHHRSSHSLSLSDEVAAQALALDDASPADHGSSYTATAEVSGSGAEDSSDSEGAADASVSVPEERRALQRSSWRAQGSADSGLLSICLQQTASKVSISGSQVSSRVWRGWGTSLAWWANYAGALPAVQRNRVLDLVFGPWPGLGLTVARYVIGGGYNPRISTQFNNGTSPLRFRGVPGFRATATGPYNWTADVGQRNALVGAKARGAKTFVAFSMSPPSWMTVSGDVAGAASKKQCNLQPTYFPAFANYLGDVLKQYATRPAWNITFHSLVPVNAPLEGFWQKGQAHEGCYFNAAQLSTLYPLVQAALSARKLTTSAAGINSVAGLSATGLGKMTQSVVLGLKNLQVAGYLYGSFGDRSAAVQKIYQQISQVAQRLKKEVWQSEWGPIGCSGADLDIALCMSKAIIQSVNIMKSVSWLYWQVVDTDPTWSLLNLPWDYSAPFKWSVTKKFFALRQFSLAVRPGSKVIDLVSGNACNHTVAAFYDRRFARITVFVVNELSTNQTLTLAFPKFRATVTKQPSVQVSVSIVSAASSYGGPQLKPTMNPVPIKLVVGPRSLTRVTVNKVIPA